MAKSSKKTTAKKSSAAPNKSSAAGTKTRRAQDNQPDNGTPLRRLLIAAATIVVLFLLLNALADNRSDKSDGDSSNDQEQSRQDNDAEQQNQDQDRERDGQTTESGNRDADAPESDSTNDTNNRLSYVVDEGESYTVMARRAVASIDGSLTPAERVAAETRLSQAAGAAELSVGQTINFARQDVQAAIDWAKSLSSEQKAVWQPYADMVDWQLAAK